MQSSGLGPPARTEHLVDIMGWLNTPVVIGVSVPETPVPVANRLDHAYPNPFNPVTTIRYSIRLQGHVSLGVYDITGALVRTIVNEVQNSRAEEFTVEWDGRNDTGAEVASGVYFYRLVAKDFDETKKMALLK